MTRDEAIKLMRQKRIFKHKSDPYYEYTIYHNVFSLRSLKQEWYPCPLPIFHEQFDDGWEIIKSKIKKTYYQGIEILHGEPHQTSPLFLCRSNCEKSYSNWQIVSFELEIEE